MCDLSKKKKKIEGSSPLIAPFRIQPREGDGVQRRIFPRRNKQDKEKKESEKEMKRCHTVTFTKAEEEEEKIKKEVARIFCQ